MGQVVESERGVSGSLCTFFFKLKKKKNPQKHYKKEVFQVWEKLVSGFEGNYTHSRNSTLYSILQNAAALFFSLHGSPDNSIC